MSLAAGRRPVSGSSVPPVLGLVLTLALAGCAFGGGSAAPPTRTADLVELEEIEGSSATNAYDLISQVRPNWLRGRGSPNLRGGRPALPVVYVTGVRQGSVETLRSIATLSLIALRYIDAPTATMRWGNGHAGGVIEVTLRRR